MELRFGTEWRKAFLFGGEMTAVKKKAHVTLVDDAELEELISSRTFPDVQEQYLKKRWLHQVRWWDDRSRSARFRFFCSRSLVVGGGALVPFLLSIAVGSPHGRCLNASAAFVSVVVAISAGIEALHNWGGIWLEKRNAAELLKAEGWLFMQGAGAYSDASTSFARFVESVENKVTAEIGQYVTAAAANQRQSVQPHETDTPAAPQP